MMKSIVETNAKELKEAVSKLNTDTTTSTTTNQKHKEELDKNFTETRDKCGM